MTAKDSMHLNEDQILRALVDEADLPEAVLEHLQGCERCHGEKKRLESGLEHMTLTARRLTPGPLRRPSLDRTESPSLSHGWWPWGWRLGLSAGVAVATVLIIAFGSLLSNSPQEKTAYLMDRETIEDEQFMAEVARLEEDSLPSMYLEISGSSEAGGNTREPADDDSIKGTPTSETIAPDGGSGRVS